MHFASIWLIGTMCLRKATLFKAYKKFNKIQRGINGLVCNCYQNYEIQTFRMQTIESHRRSLISLDFMHSLKNEALRRHIVPGGVREDFRQHLIRI